ncbi:MAG: hypothetical protein L6305_02150 [Actinomycetia bacterium]|nr:hypothetical protein [Actinomycetota bacterium]MCG2790535.1 hypothetical protein [Actinomycetes bacterium]
MKIKIVIPALIAAFVFASFIGCTLGPVEIEEIVICKNVDDTYKPVEPMDTFPSGTQAIYISVKINYITPEDKITTKWYYLETGEEINTADFAAEKSGSGYHAFRFICDKGFSSGRYNAMVYLNNELIETVEFSVE